MSVPLLSNRCCNYFLWLSTKKLFYITVAQQMSVTIIFRINYPAIYQECQVCPTQKLIPGIVCVRAQEGSREGEGGGRGGGIRGRERGRGGGGEREGRRIVSQPSNHAEIFCVIGSKLECIGLHAMTVKLT